MGFSHGENRKALMGMGKEAKIVAVDARENVSSKMFKTVK